MISMPTCQALIVKESRNKLKLSYVLNKNENEQLICKVHISFISL